MLRFRAESISDYEALDDIHFLPLDPDPKYIFCLGRARCYETWKKLCDEKKNEKLYNKYEGKIVETKDLFVEENLKIKNSLWDLDDDEFSYDS